MADATIFPAYQPRLADQRELPAIILGVSSTLCWSEEYASWHVRFGREGASAVPNHMLAYLVIDPSNVVRMVKDMLRNHRSGQDATPTVVRHPSMAIIPTYDPNDANDRLLAMSVIGKLRQLQAAPAPAPATDADDPVAYLYREMASKQDQFRKLADLIQEHLDHETNTSFTTQVFAFQVHSALKTIEILREFNQAPGEGE